MNYVDQADFVFKSLFGSHPTYIDRIEEGVMNEKFKVDLSGRRYLLRFYLLEGNKKLKYEPSIIKRLKHEGVKVPTIIHFSEGLGNKTGPFIIYEWIQGETVSNFLKTNPFFNSPQFIDDLVTNLEMVSSLKLKGFGDLESGDGGRCNSFKAFLADRIKDGIKNLERAQESNYYSTRKIESFCNQFLTDAFNLDVSPSLIWSDMSFDNMIISNERLQGFIDFEYLYSGDENMTLGYFYSKSRKLQLTNEIIEHFRPSKFKTAPFEDTLVFYSLFRFINLSKYFNTALPNGNDRTDFFKVFPGIEASLEEFRN